MYKEMGSRLLHNNTQTHRESSHNFVHETGSQYRFFYLWYHVGTQKIWGLGSFQIGVAQPVLFMKDLTCKAHLYPVNFPPWMRSVTEMLLREIYITMWPTSNPRIWEAEASKSLWVQVKASLVCKVNFRTTQWDPAPPPQKIGYGPGEVTLWLYRNSKNYGKERNCYYIYFYYY